MHTPSAAPLLPITAAARLSLRDAAHVYAAAGYPVFPCWPGTKRPATHQGFYDATTRAAQIDAWWAWQPAANIGLRTGDRVDVLDIDVHPSGDGFTALRRLRDAGVGQEWAHAVRSPSGGLHLYYPADPAQPHPSWSRSRAHVDFRGTGGYIIAPPSRITSAGTAGGYLPVGPAYAGKPIDAEQTRDLLSPRRPPLPILTAGALNLGERAERIIGWLAGFEGSNRNEAVFWSACRLVEAGASEAETCGYLAESAAALGLSFRETLATIRNAYQQASPDIDPSARTAAVVRADVWSLE